MSSVRRRLLTGGVAATAGVLGVAGAAQASGDLHTPPAVSAAAAATTTAGATVSGATVSQAGSTGSGSTGVAASAAAREAAHRRTHPRAGLLGRAEYGQLVVRRHGADVTLAFQRGTVTAVTATASTAVVTVRSVDGHAQVYAVTAARRLRAHGVLERPTSLRVGERVSVLAQVAGGRDTVVRLAVRPSARAAAPAAAGASPTASSTGT